MQNYRFIIEGKVQGVSYRRTVSDKAKLKGFKGYVKNLENGNVEAGVSLDDEGFVEFISILEEGSASSRVDNIKQSIIDEGFEKDFEIRY